jgi:hypothetical protein
MFEWLGTFNRTQFERFIAFARSQLPLVESRIEHLQAEKSRTGSLVFTFGDDNVPVSVVADPAESYLGKLLAAYEVLGGNPFLELRTRTKNQAIFVVRGNEAKSATVMSNGEVLPGGGLQDAFSAELVRTLRSPINETLDYRSTMLERKIRRALDYTDQLDVEIVQLRTMQAAATTEGSLEFVANRIQQLFGDRNYRAIFDDNGTDPLGNTTYAPFSQYDVESSVDPAVGGPNRIVERPQRQGSGFVGPGGSSR